MKSLVYVACTTVVSVFLSWSCCVAQDAELQKPVIHWRKMVAINHSSVQLQWQLQEINLADSIDFAIERSTDGINFQKIGRLFLPADGPNPAFSFTDNTSISDSLFYRVVWNRAQQEPIISPAQKILTLLKPKIDISIMPNPVFNNACLIMNFDELGEVSCTLFDMGGKAIRSYQFRKGTPYMQHILEMYNIPRGDYLLNIRGSSINETRRILKQ